MTTIKAGASRLGSRWWWWFVVYGVALGVVGILALGNIMDAALVTTVFVGWLLLFGGIMQLVGAVTMGGGAWRIFHAGLGILYIVVGFNLIADPFSGAITLTLALGLLLIFDGAGRLAGAFAQRGDINLGGAPGHREHRVRLLAVDGDPRIGPGDRPLCWSRAAGCVRDVDLPGSRDASHP